MKLQSRYDKSKNPVFKDYKEISFDEAKQLANKHVQVIDDYGKVANVLITSVKTWKRKPLNIEVHYKFGLYEYGTINYVDGKNTSGNLLVKEVCNE